MAAQALNLDAKTLWGGKESPFSTSYGKLMMWFFWFLMRLLLVHF